MKKIVLFLLTISLTQLSVGQINIGLKTGFNSSRYSTIAQIDVFDPTVAQSYDWGHSYLVGPYARFELTKIQLQVELLYSSQKNELNFIGETQTQRRGYLDIPVVAKLKLPAKLSFEIGPQVGYLVFAELNGSENRDAFNKLLLSGVTGLSWKTNWGLNLGIRYTYSLRDPYQFTTPSNSFKDLRNSVVQFTVGYDLF